jgi:hypothetical protein
LNLLYLLSANENQKGAVSANVACTVISYKENTAEAGASGLCELCELSELRELSELSELREGEYV